METAKQQKYEFLMIQYKMVREEIIKSMNNQMKILQIAILVIGGLFYGHILIANNLSADSDIDTYIFAILIPGVCFCFSLMLLSEISRMLLCGRFLKSIEEKIPHTKGILYFEQWLQNINDKDKYMFLRSLKYLMVIGMFWFLSLLSLLYCFSNKGLHFGLFGGGLCFILNLGTSCFEMLRIKKLVK